MVQNKVKNGENISSDLERSTPASRVNDSFTSDENDVCSDFKSLSTIPLNYSNTNNAIIPSNDIINRVSNTTPGPVIDSICVQSVSDVTFGNRIIYKGPVTIENMNVKAKNDTGEYFYFYLYF